MISQNNLSTITSNKAVIYIRVSSEEQVENFSLGTQEALCRRDAKQKGYEIVEVFREEGRSAKTILGRPELLRLLDYCRKNKKEVRAVFAYRIDRLSRQTADFLAIRKKLAEYNISFISASEPTGNSPTEKLLETVLASFAQHDNDVRSERTKNGMKARYLSGLITNHAPLGYLNQSGYAVKDSETFDTIKKAWDLASTGTKSLREMTLILNDWGIKINVKSLHNLFHNKFYAGYMTSRKYPEVVKGQHIPMITEEQFYKVQAILNGRNNNKIIAIRKSKDSIEFPLRRILHCGRCGTPFTGAWSKGRSNRYGYYFCRARCIPKSVTINDAEVDLKAHLKSVNPTENGLKLFISCLLKTYTTKISTLDKSRKEADREIDKLKALRQVLIDKNLAGLYSDDIFKEQNASIEVRMIAAQSAKDEVLIEQYNIEKVVEFIKKKLSDLALTYETSTLSQIRCLLGSIFLSGLAWDYPGCSNRGFSPIYQAIREFEHKDVSLGDPGGIRTRDQELKRLLLYR